MHATAILVIPTLRVLKPDPVLSVVPVNLAIVCPKMARPAKKSMPVYQHRAVLWLHAPKPVPVHIRVPVTRVMRVMGRHAVKLKRVHHSRVQPLVAVAKVPPPVPSNVPAMKGTERRVANVLKLICVRRHRVHRMPIVKRQGRVPLRARVNWATAVVDWCAPSLIAARLIHAMDMLRVP